VKIEISPAAAAQFAKMPQSAASGLISRLETVATKPFGSYPWAKRLQGMAAYRVRAGDYRAIYRIDTETQTIVVTKAGHRKDVYR
jgi:mRNA interferase RelE/StbE